MNYKSFILFKINPVIFKIYQTVSLIFYGLQMLKPDAKNFKKKL